MKKTLTLTVLLFLLVSCGTNEEIILNKEVIDIEDTNFVVWWKENNYLNVYWNIVSNNSKILTSNINWVVEYLSCDAWNNVDSNTVIARILPDSNSLSYKNNLIQVNSLKSQLINLKQIKWTTVLNFESKYRQLKLQESELKNQLNTVNKTIWNNDEWLNNQLKIIEESLVLLQKNRESTLKKIDDSIVNIRKTSFNAIESWFKRLDEVFWITNKNKHLNDDYENYIWAKNTWTKNEVKSKIKVLIDEFSKQDEKLSLYSNDELSLKLDTISSIFKDSADVIDDSISSVWAFSESTINKIYWEFLWISNWLITIKNNYEVLVNTRNSTVLTFDAKEKELESNKSQLLTQETWLNSNVITINNNTKNLKEQYDDLGNTKTSTIKEIDINILSLEQAINQLNITFREDFIYAWTVWTIKSKKVNVNNNISIGTPICVIVPDNNSLRLEVYSPNTIKIWTIFKYYNDSNYIWTWSIISELPVRNSLTQNYTYEGFIDFYDYKEWDYLDIKVISEISDSEIWVPLNYVFPKLDWYYVNLIEWDNVTVKKIEVWKMNNWEIKIIFWLQYGDILKQ